MPLCPFPQLAQAFEIEPFQELKTLNKEIFKTKRKLGPKAAFLCNFWVFKATFGTTNFYESDQSLVQCHQSVKFYQNWIIRPTFFKKLSTLIFFNF